MPFTVLYVENNEAARADIVKAVKASNESGDALKLSVIAVEDPAELKKELSFDVDVVLADVFFDDPETGFKDTKNMLADIIRYVKEASVEGRAGLAIPIIAYTGRTDSALKLCLDHVNDLYDIWDKKTASAAYVSWRLRKLAAEVSRIAPDVELQRKIIKMPTSSVPWHPHVVEMARRYSSAWNEKDQIGRAGAVIATIAHELGTFSQCQQMWEIMTNWEFLSRSVSPRVRGHARHVINVFWLGYFLIQHDLLKTWFACSWKSIAYERGHMKPVEHVDPVEAFTCSWFYAGLYHDVGGCVEKACNVFEHENRLLGQFNGYFAPPKADSETKDEPKRLHLPEIDMQVCRSRALAVAVQLGGEFVDLLPAALEEGLLKEHPDHGVIAASHLISQISSGRAGCYAKEASRAMALHNIVPKLHGAPELKCLTWGSEPLACLLLLCDQIQTWDRERGNPSIHDEDSIERAELVAVDVVEINGKPFVSLCVNYIPPRYISRSPEHFERLRDNLELVLRTNPVFALSRISGDWPFGLEVTFRLNGKRLDTTFVR